MSQQEEVDGPPGLLIRLAVRPGLHPARLVAAGYNTTADFYAGRRGREEVG